MEELGREWIRPHMGSSHQDWMSLSKISALAQLQIIGHDGGISG